MIFNPQATVVEEVATQDTEEQEQPSDSFLQ
jgi:hypothetical protein